MKTLAADMKHTTDQMGEGPSPPLAVRVNHSGMGPLWKMKGMPHQAHVTTPRILDLDVNMTRLAAHAIVSQVSKGPWDQLSKSLPQLMTFKPRTFMQKSISQPSSKGIRSFQSKRTLTLPPIAGFYSSDDFTNVQKEQS
ncbi:hypothetical protein QZH41_015651 [Actinostola sp. cb2023]|nr:hypothetical protein QZH41_015651 [Actinostola sp. cb2023]